jgi:hypothetical protein
MLNLKEVGELTVMVPPQAWVRDGSIKSLALLRASCPTITFDVTLLSSPATAPKNNLDNGY